MFSQKEIELFKDNGYKVEQLEDTIVIKRSNTERYSIVIFEIFMILVSLFLMALSPFIGMATLILSVLITLKAGNKSKGRSSIKLNLKDGWFESVEERWGKMSRYFNEVEEIGCHSKFYDEYATATKSTSKEYLHDIHIRLASNHKIDLFRFQEDYLEPSDTINEVIDSLKKTFAGARL